MKLPIQASRQPFLSPLKGAFSLVEVMMSLGIATLGFTTMLGLLPHGLTMVQSSAELSAESRIRQKLAGELLTAPWQQLQWTGYGPVRYFTDEGIELPESESGSGGGVNLSLAYAASLLMPEEALDIQLPSGGQPQDRVQPYLRRVKICIAKTNSPDFDFASAPPRRVTSHTTLLAKTGE
jgi:uncharacterized protein (TIGR02598 family)